MLNSRVVAGAAVKHAMGLIHRLFHNSSTSMPQAEINERLRILEAALKDLKHEFVLMNRENEDFVEKTGKRLDRYRKWYQNRKDGKWSAEDAPESTNEKPLAGQPTHEQIEAEARKKGLIL